MVKQLVAVSVAAKCNPKYSLLCLYRSAWHKVGTLSQALARQKYVSLVSELFPTWQPDLSIYKPQGTPAGPVFSSLAHAGGGIDLPNTLVSAALGMLTAISGILNNVC